MQLKRGQSPSDLFNKYKDKYRGRTIERRLRNFYYMLSNQMAFEKYFSINRADGFFNEQDRILASVVRALERGEDVAKRLKDFSDNYSLDTFKELARDDFFDNYLIKLYGVYITDRCSHYCTDCGKGAVKSNRNNLDFKKFKTFLSNNAEKLDLSSVVLTGGNPFEFSSFGKGIVDLADLLWGSGAQKLIMTTPGWSKEDGFHNSVVDQLYSDASHLGKDMNIAFSVNPYMPGLMTGIDTVNNVKLDEYIARLIHSIGIVSNNQKQIMLQFRSHKQLNGFREYMLSIITEEFQDTHFTYTERSSYPLSRGALLHKKFGIKETEPKRCQVFMDSSGFMVQYDGEMLLCDTLYKGEKRGVINIFNDTIELIPKNVTGYIDSISSAYLDFMKAAIKKNEEPGRFCDVCPIMKR